MGPNRLRSTTLAWKNARPKSILRNSASLAQPVKKALSVMGSMRYVRCRPARSPFGASLVILMPDSRMEMGKMSEGYEVSHRRKLRLTEPSTSCVSQIISSCGRNDLARWQFCSTYTTACTSVQAPAVSGPEDSRWHSFGKTQQECAHHPEALFRALVDPLLRNRALALPKRHGLHAHAAIVCELEQRRHGVAAGREHEDEGRDSV